MRRHRVIEAMREARKACGWSVDELARRANTTGNTISRWETGNAVPTLEHLTAVLAALGLEIDVVAPGSKPAGRPVVRVEPPVRFGNPHVGSISCESLAERVYADGMAAVLADHELRREDILVACWYVGRHGPPRWRRRWRAWATEAGAAMWRASTVDYSRIPDPPDGPDGPATPTPEGEHHHR